MAVMDRLRDRIQGQRPVGAAQGMQQPPAQMMTTEDMDRMRRRPEGGRVPMMGGMTEGDLDMLASPRTAEEEQARRMGERMGAESIMAMAGMTPIRKQEMADGGRIMNPERLNKATQTLLRYQSSMKTGACGEARRIRATRDGCGIVSWGSTRT